jgi:nitric oxide reductase subunit B
MKDTRIRAVLLFVVVAAFTVLIFGGAQIAKHKPPIPERVTAADGQVVFTGEDIRLGQRYYLAHGGQEMGSIWGHGAYLAPDWSADALHRVALVTAGLQAGLPPAQAQRFDQAAYEALETGRRGEVQARTAEELKRNRYDAASGTLALSPGQAAAVPVLTAYYTTLFRDGSDPFSIPAGVVDSDENGRRLTAFFFWTAWAAMTDRPDADYTYTANWPFDPLAGNTPVPSALLWSIASVVLLILGIALAIFFYLRSHDESGEATRILPLVEPAPTPSQRLTLYYFLAAALLFLVQVGVGSLTGHYAVEGNRLFGLDLGKILPYAAARTWHLQLSVFWIATCWLATGLYLGPAVSGREPRRQAAWAAVLLGALVVVVVGTLVGTWLGVTGRFGGDGFLFGHQGYEYLDLGRVWQIALILGMLLWLVLVWRSIRPALDRETDRGGLTHLLLYASVSIPLFYSVGLFYNPGTHLSIADYWRWWVVHLWVENFFEVFATVALAFVLTRMGAVRTAFAERTVYFSILLYLGAGIVGTFHHLYFSGTPLMITSLGATFSALEVVPLTLLGFEVNRNLKLARLGGDAAPYRWPLWFFIAVAFWNMLGAGVFGFLINPPIVLYYAQGLNTTPIHSHGALFGVYGFLAIALALFSVRHIVRREAWSDRLLKWSFIGLNAGLFLMIFVSLVPAGFYQFLQAVKHGTWYARGPEVTGSSFIHTVTWLRLPADLIFDVGVVAFLAFLVRAIVLDRKLRAGEQAKAGGQGR